MERLKLLCVLGLMMLLLTACFRDAGEQEANPTSVPLENFLAQSSPTDSPQTLIPTLTSTPELAPTKTLAAGGPPIEDGESGTDESTDEAAIIPQRTLPPTLAIPSFTPSGGSTFGDSGITPTNVIGTQPAPDALITPTDFAEIELECVYVVQPNDTLYRIATALDVVVDDLIAVNPALIANPHALQIGQQLAIPHCVVGEVQAAPTTPPDSPVTATPDGSGTRTHTIQVGDSLFRIALQYGVELNALLAANGLSENSIIQPGQELIIPQ